MADESANGSASRARRSSFAGQTFAELFGNGRNSSSRNSAGEGGNSPPSQYQGPITTAAAQAQRRRLSLTTLGLGNTNGQPSSFNSVRGRQDSFGSGGGSIDECAVEDDVSSKENSTPATPFARRVSFGARAMMDIRNGGQQSPGQPNGRSPPSNPSSASKNTRGGGSSGDSNAKTSSVGTISARDVKGRGSGEGFNWSDNFRNRAERTSTSGPVAMGSSPSSQAHQRAKSVAVMEPPVRESPREQKRPDHFQERILKGDFYMD